MRRTTMRQIATRGLAIAAALTLVPTAAHAHPGIGEMHGFTHGFAHPLGGLDHVLAMVTVGIFAWQLGGRALWLVPAAFVVAMAGAFGYGADTIDVSMAMGELSLLPAVRKADADTLIVADGTSCRHQIHDGAQRDALHVARVLAMSVEKAGATSSNTLSP